MSLIIEPITLELKSAFQTAHGASVSRAGVLAHIGAGVGEGALMPHVNYSPADIAAYADKLDPDFLRDNEPLALEDRLDRLPSGPAPARAAIDVALHDDWARRLGYPLYRLWGLNPARAPLSSITVSLPENEAELQQRLRAVTGWPILKLKLGSGDVAFDEEMVCLARQTSQARLCVDANSAWSVDEAVHLIPRLAAYDLLFIEQPIAPTEPEGWRRLRRQLPAGLPPLIADESAQQTVDLPALAGLADGVNIKLAKAGGLREARRMITLARILGLKVMLGCAIESSAGITAAAHLAPLADFVDLDGNLDLTNDPYRGVRLVKGRLHFPPGPGLGLERR